MNQGPAKPEHPGRDASSASALPKGRIAAVDYGTARIGVAIADSEAPIATPLVNYTRRTAALDAAFFVDLARREAIVRFVVGLPVHLDGRESQKSREARQFGGWLSALTGVEVVYFDERFTSSEALETLSAAKLTKKKRRARLDMLAAQILLTAYLERGRFDRGAAADLASPLGLDD
jgi:putative Holliday junction resolvase